MAVADRTSELTRARRLIFDDQLDDLSAKAQAGWTERLRTTLQELPRRVAFEKLARPSQIDVHASPKAFPND